MKLIIVLRVFLVVVSLLVELPVFAQPCFDVLTPLLVTARAREVMHDNEFVTSSPATGNFFCDPLLLNGKPLDYNTFSIQSKGELTLVKGAAVTGETTQIPFYVYLRRNGEMVKLPGEDVIKSKYLIIEISEILKLAVRGDQLIIEPVNKEDWQAKRILKLLEDGC